MISRAALSKEEYSNKQKFQNCLGFPQSHHLCPWACPWAPGPHMVLNKAQRSTKQVARGSHRYRPCPFGRRADRLGHLSMLSMLPKRHKERCIRSRLSEVPTGSLFNGRAFGSGTSVCGACFKKAPRIRGPCSLVLLWHLGGSFPAKENPYKPLSKPKKYTDTSPRLPWARGRLQCPATCVHGVSACGH